MAVDPISILLGIGSKVIDRLWPDPAQRDAAKLELLKMQQSGDLAQLTADTSLMIEQIKVNAAEATNPSLFVSGWRPGVGWVCVAACGWNWIGLPVAKVIAVILGHPIDLAPADLTEMLPILMGMLGLGGLRTIEKLQGRASK
jgi:hypothetical protein